MLEATPVKIAEIAGVKHKHWRPGGDVVRIMQARNEPVLTPLAWAHVQVRRQQQTL